MTGCHFDGAVNRFFADFDYIRPLEVRRCLPTFVEPEDACGSTQQKLLDGRRHSGSRPVAWTRETVPLTELVSVLLASVQTPNGA
jgi:hypothetical protein